MRDAIGWASSVILVLTLTKQVYKQYKSGTSEGVSKWLFVGQLAASLGFTIYSALLGSVVFVVTNGLMVVNALAGLAIYWRHRASDARKRPTDRSRSRSSGGHAGTPGRAASVGPTGAPT